MISLFLHFFCANVSIFKVASFLVRSFQAKLWPLYDFMALWLSWQSAGFEPRLPRTAFAKSPSILNEQR